MLSAHAARIVPKAQSGLSDCGLPPRWTRPAYPPDQRESVNAAPQRHDTAMVETGTYREVMMGGKTSGTRHGTGMGWGGPPRGDVVAGKAGRPPGVKNGEGKRSVADLMAERGAREIVADRWVAIIDDPAHPHHAVMLEKAATRLDGAPLQSVSGPDGGPIQQRLEVIIIDEHEARNEDSAAASAAGADELTI